MASATVELWKDPDARWASGVDGTGHPSGDIDHGEFPADHLGSTFASTISMTVTCRQLSD